MCGSEDLLVILCGGSLRFAEIPPANLVACIPTGGCHPRQDVRELCCHMRYAIMVVDRVQHPCVHLWILSLTSDVHVKETIEKVGIMMTASPCQSLVELSHHMQQSTSDGGCKGQSICLILTALFARFQSQCILP